MYVLHYSTTLVHSLGAFLERCSQIETKLAESEKRFQEKATSSFITPLKAFLEIDVKNVLVRRKFLNLSDFRVVDLNPSIIHTHSIVYLHIYFTKVCSVYLWTQKYLLKSC